MTGNLTKAIPTEISSKLLARCCVRIIDVTHACFLCAPLSSSSRRSIIEGRLLGRAILVNAPWSHRLAALRLPLLHQPSRFSSTRSERYVPYRAAGPTETLPGHLPRRQTPSRIVRPSRGYSSTPKTVLTQSPLVLRGNVHEGSPPPTRIAAVPWPRPWRSCRTHAALVRGRKRDLR